MECKYCGAPLSGEETVCPVCGAPVNWEDGLAAEAERSEETAEETEVPEEAAETVEAVAAEENSSGENGAAVSKKKAPAKFPVAAIAAIVVLLAIIAVLVALLVRDRKTEEPAVEEEPAFVPSVSYVREDFDDSLLDQVVSTCGDSTLTNRKLAYYYWREFYSFVNIYSSYIPMLMDPTARLDTQAYTEEQSWDQFFMEMAVKTYQTCAAAANEARKEGYVLGEEDQEYLDNLSETIGDLAEQYGYASADEYLAQSFGPYCTMESYQEFMDEYILGASYLNARLDQREITDEELDAYYEENEESFVGQGLEKDDRPMVNVRHILIRPEAVELQEGDEGYEEAVQAAKDEAKAKAEELYQQWQDGDKTEDSFAELAMDNSADSSASAGGLIEEIHPGQTVEAFDAWCFDESRQPGDTDIIETPYGYHILFYAGQCEESYWHRMMYDSYRSECYTEICEEIRALYPEEADLTKAAVYPSNMGV